MGVRGASRSAWCVLRVRPCFPGRACQAEPQAQRQQNESHNPDRDSAPAGSSSGYPCVWAEWWLEMARRGSGGENILTTTSLSSTRFLLMVVDFPSHFCTCTRAPPSKVMRLWVNRRRGAVTRRESTENPPPCGQCPGGHSKLLIMGICCHKKLNECQHTL